MFTPCDIFMRRDKFQMRIHEGEFEDERGSDDKSKKRKRSNYDPGQSGFYVETITLIHKIKSIDTQILSFVFTTPPILGKFLPEKAKELGVPAGPLYSKLKGGQAVTVVVNGIEKIVESHEVLLEGGPGVAVAIIYCPSREVLLQLQQSKQLEKLKDVAAKDTPVMDVMVHMTPFCVFHDVNYQKWIGTFPKPVDHIWIDSMENIGDNARIPNGSTAFRSAALGAMTRSLIHSGLYPSPIDQSEYLSGEPYIPAAVDRSIILARRMLHYALIPRGRKGLVSAGFIDSEKEIEEAKSQACESGATTMAKEILLSIEAKPSEIADLGELIFTGTGSALPCKHRNVSGILLRARNRNAMLLDVGEGTIGQLLRANPGNRDFTSVLRSIQAVWISHPHADHHLGLLRLLSEQGSIPDSRPLILMAPPSLFRFLEEYREVDASIRDRYIQVDCRDMVLPKKIPPAVLSMLQHRLSITNCQAVPVSHCPDSFAVILDGTPFGRLSYSGDCRPSTQFAEQAMDTDVLIHEATFEDGMEDEAVLKKHSTVAEALAIGRKMRSKAIILTHFSQRYPKLPQLRGSEAKQEVPVVFAFDFMRITPATLDIAARLTPSLRLLYPEEEQKPKEALGDIAPQITAKAILSVPGLFAQKELL